ncbi:hypothetical protein ACWE42_24510 [Sutcliffiella cohnii]
MDAIGLYEKLKVDLFRFARPIARYEQAKQFQTKKEMFCFQLDMKVLSRRVQEF